MYFEKNNNYVSVFLKNTNTFCPPPLRTGLTQPLEQTCELSVTEKTANFLSAVQFYRLLQNKNQNKNILLSQQSSSIKMLCNVYNF